MLVPIKDNKTIAFLCDLRVLCGEFFALERNFGLQPGSQSADQQLSLVDHFGREVIVQFDEQLFVSDYL